MHAAGKRQLKHAAGLYSEPSFSAHPAPQNKTCEGQKASIPCAHPEQALFADTHVPQKGGMSWTPAQAAVWHGCRSGRVALHGKCLWPGIEDFYWAHGVATDVAPAAEEAKGEGRGWQCLQPTKVCVNGGACDGQPLERLLPPAAPHLPPDSLPAWVHCGHACLNGCQ